MAIITAFLVGIQMLSDIGIAASVIQNPRGEDPDFLATSWTIQIIRSLFLWSLTIFIAAPASWFYDEPRLMLMLPIMGLGIAIQGFKSISIALENRKLNLRKITSFQLASQVIGTVALVIIAWQFRSVWALVAGFLINSMVEVVLSHLLLTGTKHRLCLDKDCVSLILGFGIWLSVASGAGVLANSFDLFSLGKLVPAAEVGVYSMALMLTSVPRAVIGHVMNLVGLPVLSSSLQQNDETGKSKYNQIRLLAYPIIFLTVFVTSYAAPPFFHLLYPPTYADAAWISQLLLIILAFDALSGMHNTMLLALGHSKASAVKSLVNFCVSACGMLLGFHWFGLPGLITGSALGALAALIVLGIHLESQGLKAIRSDMEWCSFFVATILISVRIYHFDISNFEFLLLLVIQLSLLLIGIQRFSLVSAGLTTVIE